MRIALVHGAGADHTLWRFQSRWLRGAGHEAHAVDLPGHGRNQLGALPSIEEMADWLAGTIETSVVVGHSMGSLVALAMARRHPERVEALVLVGSGERMPVHPELLKAASDDLDLAARLIAGWSVPAAFRGGHREPGTWQMAGTARLTARSRPGVLATDLAACAAHTAATDGVDLPVLVVNGGSDRMTPSHGAAALAGAIERARYLEIDEVGHEPMIQCPRLFNAILDDFLAEVAAQRVNG